MSAESPDPLNDLAGALDVEPSRAFAAGVRRRVDAQASAPTWPWRLAAATIGAIGLVSWLAVVSRPQTRATAPASAPAVAERAQSPAEPVVPEWRAERPSARLHTTTRPVVQRARGDVQEAREPEVLVSSDQRLALDQLKAALADGRLDASVLPANLIEAPAPIAPAPPESSDSLGGGRANTIVLPRLEAPRHFVGRVVRTAF